MNLSHLEAELGVANSELLYRRHLAASQASHHMKPRHHVEPRRQQRLRFYLTFIFTEY